jgi:phosphate:Na+ symporter
MVFLGPLAAAADWVGSRLDHPDGVVALAAFSSLFKLAGIAAFYPWIDQYARLIVRIAGSGDESALARLDPKLADAGAAVALEAAWRAILELAHGAVGAVRRRLAGASAAYEPPADAVQQVDRFLESLSLETIDLHTMGPRLVRLCHALDHLTELRRDLAGIPPPTSGAEPPAGFARGAEALAAWLEATKPPEAAPDPAVFAALEDAWTRLSAECRAGRERTLEDIALQRTPTATARILLETLGWADRALYHAWCLAESLRVASGVA